jgi:hypothetical protein
MAVQTTHDEHVEPSFFWTAIPLWLVSIPALWVLVTDHPQYQGAWIGAFVVWLPICLGVIGSVDCRNANHMDGWSSFKCFALLVAPYATVLAALFSLG